VPCNRHLPLLWNSGTDVTTAEEKDKTPAEITSILSWDTIPFLKTRKLFIHASFTGRIPDEFA
jgi:hypothetical protein